MNNLSWLLYLADVLPTLGKVLIILCSIGLLVNAFLSLVLAVEEEWDILLKTRIWGFVVCVFLLLVGCLIPSKKTIYLIAASEMGEQALNSEAGQKVVDFLEQTLDEAINDGP